jgi:hypothetical protein
MYVFSVTLSLSVVHNKNKYVSEQNGRKDSYSSPQSSSRKRETKSETLRMKITVTEIKITVTEIKYLSKNDSRMRARRIFEKKGID